MEVIRKAPHGNVVLLKTTHGTPLLLLLVHHADQQRWQLLLWAWLVIKRPVPVHFGDLEVLEPFERCLHGRVQGHRPIPTREARGFRCSPGSPGLGARHGIAHFSLPLSCDRFPRRPILLLLDRQ